MAVYNPPEGLEAVKGTPSQSKMKKIVTERSSWAPEGGGSPLVQLLHAYYNG